MPKVKEHAKGIPEVEERQKHFVLDNAQNHEPFCFLDFCQCNIANSVVHAPLWFCVLSFVCVLSLVQ